MTRAPQTAEDRHEAQAFYASRRWRQFRAAFLAGAYAPDRSPQVWCADCEAEGWSTLAEELDHVVPRILAPELAFDPANIRPLCKRHHSQKTRREQLGQEHAQRVVICGKPSAARDARVEALMREGFLGVPLNLAAALPDHEYRLLLGVLSRHLSRDPLARGVLVVLDRRTAERWAGPIGASIEEFA